MRSLVFENWVFLIKNQEIVFGVRVYHTKTDFFHNAHGMVNELHINSYLFSKTTLGHCTSMSNISDSITAFYHKFCSQLMSLKSPGKFTCSNL